MNPTVPTNFPSGDRRTIRVGLPAAPVELFVTEDGKRWKLVGHDADGIRLFVPELVDPAVTPRWVWAKEPELVEVVGPLRPLERAA